MRGERMRGGGSGEESEGREGALQVLSSFSLVEGRSDGDCGSYGVSHRGQRSRQRTETVPGLAAALGPWELLTETPVVIIRATA